MRRRAQLGQAGGQLVVVAPPAGVQDGAGGAAAERVDGGQVDPPCPERAAEDQHARLVGPDAEAPPGGGAVRAAGPRRQGAADHAVALALAAGDRERQEHAPGEPGQQPVGDAQVAVGLGGHHGQPERPGGKADRGRHVAAAAHHGVGAQAPQQPARGDRRARGAEHGAGGAQRVAAVDPLHPQRVEAEPGRRHQLGLGPLAADELDPGAAIPQRGGDGQRRDHVPRRPARGDHDRRHRDLRRSSAAAAWWRARAGHRWPPR